MNTRTRGILYFGVGLVIGAGVIMGIASRKIDPGTTPVDMSAEGRPQYKWHVPHIPKSMEFCGENVPLDKWEVREKLDREVLVNTYLHGTQLYILKLSGRYFPIIEARLRANNMPEDLKYVCVAESALQQNAWSAVGAASFWQFMKDTGPRYGLEINDEVDERFNVVKATDAACQYFKEARDKFGSWTAAAASYNCGMAGYAKQADFQQATNYYDLIFPEETNRYVFRILAFKHIMSDPRRYGLTVEESEEYRPLKYRTVNVDHTIADLTEFAKENGTSYKMLKIYNPWLRAHKLTVKPGKTYEIQLPVN
ncbi:lytic transglycosylase domain-containing protein [Nemorincola caseinilytica]|uniref:Lytic transglycosylase domain-containing protein n=1 Tax=Nemorincola caseinilytica TaxID=2054315 RepID=A0ABP8N3F6_9BACT